MSTEYRRPTAHRPLATGAHVQLDALEEYVDDTLAMAARIVSRELGFRPDELVSHGLPQAIYQMLNRLELANPGVATEAAAAFLIDRPVPEPPEYRIRCSTFGARVIGGRVQTNCLSCGHTADEHPVYHPAEVVS